MEIRGTGAYNWILILYVAQKKGFLKNHLLDVLSESNSINGDHITMLKK